MSLPVTIQAGDFLVLREDVYQYGIGELVIRVAGIHRLHDPAWVAIDGVEIAWNGCDGMPRSVRVKTEALAEAKRLGDTKHPQ